MPLVLKKKCADTYHQFETVTWGGVEPQWLNGRHCTGTLAPKIMFSMSVKNYATKNILKRCI